MTTEISFADWVDWLAMELTFVELYRSATVSEKRELTETVRRLAAGIGETDVEAFVSQVPNLERALDSFSVEERERFVPQLSNSVTELAQHVASVITDRD
ncbi:hypothetical protein [Candidatus Palauibacter sp.]|uniref:hypothetical protein n=1 Tax=Candidatus Palauibacter sp. TaxID=3101350 RepID=UPI003B59E9BD